MALHVQVRQDASIPTHYTVTGNWEDSRPDGLRVLVPHYPNMTAAESVEYYMLLSENMVASWGWSQDCCGINGELHGQFVTAGDGDGKSYKEVTYSRAHEFDLPTPRGL
jgi:hypothetical protein